ncbi:MAG: SIMPL domain-containing protein [Chloroflexota bacterium]
MKQFSNYVNVGLTCILVFSLLAFGLPATRAQAAPAVEEPSSDCDSSRTVQVSGTAVVNIAPDRVLIQLGVQSNGATPESVEAANTAAIRRVIRAIEGEGVASRDISTEWYIIEPVYEYYDSLHIDGYRINNVVSITLREVSKVSNVMAAALEAGANQVVNVEFYTSQLRTYRDQARENAMTAAVEKARDLAAAAGAETGCVLSISENSWSYYSGWWYGGSNLWNQNSIQNVAPAGGAGSQGDDGPVTPGQISVRAEVVVTLGLK